jgi:SAM-dependent methyltransferase
MNLKKALKPYIPPKLSAFPYVVAWRARHWFRAIFRPDPFDPPMEAGSPGVGDFRQIGDHFLELFRTLAGLRPDDRILEIGCSVGRMAAPLTRSLVTPGTYDGLDISKRSIRWCRWAIGRKFGNFRFTHADIFNGEYNPRGTIAAEQYTFPFPDGVFDFVFLTSVFTHMLPPSVRRYLDEIRRVLRPGGRVLATFFLIPAGPADGGSWIGHEGPGYRTSNPHRPEEAIAYEEGLVREWFRASGLTIVEPVHRGSWTNFEHGITYQDVIVAVRQ